MTVDFRLFIITEYFTIVQSDIILINFIYHLSLFIRRGIFPFQNNPTNLDSSFKTDLDIWAGFGRTEPYYSRIRALDKREYLMMIFSYFSSKPYVVTPSSEPSHRMRGHNICFYAEITKIISNYHYILPLI